MAIKFFSGIDLSNVTAGSILKVDSNGVIVAAVDGTDYNTSSGTWSDASSGNIYYNSGGVRIGTYQASVDAAAQLHVFDYQSTDVKLLIEDGNTGDASMQFKVSAQSYVMGLDNSDSDRFKLSAGTAFGSTGLTMKSTGQLGINGLPNGDLDVISASTPTLFVRTSAVSSQDAIVRIQGSRTTSTTSEIAQIRFETVDSDSSGTELARISALKDTTSTNVGRLEFFTMPTNGGSLSSRMTIKGDGKVGIGTNTPAGQFQSYISSTRYFGHNVNSGDLSVVSDNNSSPVFKIQGTGTADLINVLDNTTNVFTVKDGGDVKIHGGDLDLRDANEEDATNVLYFNANNGNAANTSNDIGTGIVWKPDYSGYSKRSAGIMQIGEGNYFKSGLAFYTNNTSDNSTDWSERMRISKEGYVGIGTSEPSYKLQVEGNVGITEYLQHKGDNNTYLRFSTDLIRLAAGGVEMIRLLEDSTQDAVVINEGGADVDFRVESDTNTHAFFVQGSDGYVGIGTSTPTSTLDVDGIITTRSASILRRHVSSWTNADTHDIIYNGWTADMGDYVYLKAQGNSTGDHGMIIVGDNVAYIGRSNVETGAANSGLDQTWATFKNGGVGIGTTNPSEKLHVSGGNILVDAQYGIRFVDANTRIYTNNDSPEDLIVEADQNLHLNPDGSILAQSSISMEGGSIITTDSNNALVLRSDVQHGQGDEDAVISFKQSTTEHAKIDQGGYMYAAGFKTTTAATGFLKADGTVDTTTLGTMASANTSDYKDSDTVESYVATELTSYTTTSSLGSNAFTSYTDHSTQGYLTASSTDLDSRYYTETELTNFFKSVTHQGNYISTANWSNDGSGSVNSGWSAEGFPFSPTGGFNQNGSGAENTRTVAELPNGAYGVVWRTPSNDADSGADGGWDMDIYNVQHAKAYRSVVYFQKTDDSTSGTFYHGCHGSHTLNTNGTANTNPYFQTLGFSNLVQGRWYVSVGYIQPYQYPTATDSTRSGIYDCYTGKKIAGGVDYMMKSGSTTQRHRTYQYYSTDPSSSINWWNPRFEEINGNEPSLAELIQRVGVDGELGLNFHSKFPAGALGSLTEATDATNDKILLWDESADEWKQMTLEDLQDSIDQNTTYSVATTSANGLMSSSDKTKLDGVATNADVTPSWVPASDPSYLTSYTETDTLDTVADRGATTNQTLTVGGITTGGTVTADVVSLTNDATNTFRHRVSVYDSGGTSYGMMLWNTNGTSGDWGTMIYGPNQSNRRISFGKVNTTTPTNHSHVSEIAHFDLDNSSLNLTGDLNVDGGDVKITKQNDAPTLTLLHDGTNPSTNDLLFKMQFQSDYDGTHQNWGKIQVETNSSSVRTDMDFYVKSTSGAEQIGLRIAGQPSETPKAFFYNDVDVDGTLSATAKSFDIEHPTKEGKRLVYGSLEGAEHGVYFRGKGTGEVIELPDHWTGLVHEDSITVQLTPIGKNCVWVEDIKDNSVHVGMDNDTPYFYFIQAERKDIDKLIVEQDA